MSGGVWKAALTPTWKKFESSSTTRWITYVIMIQASLNFQLNYNKNVQYFCDLKKSYMYITFIKRQ